MATPPMTDELLVETANAVRQHGSQSQAALALGIARQTLQNRLMKAAERGLMGYAPVLPGYAIKSIASKDADGTWVRQTKEPGEIFETPAGHRLKGVSALVDGEGREVLKWLKTSAQPDPLAIAEAIKAAFEGWEPRSEISPEPVCDEDLATLLMLPDCHLGQLSWSTETGSGDYDLQIAEKTITDAFARLVAASPPSKLAIVLGLGDLLHSDGYENTTARSKNVLDVDSRWPRVLQTAARLIIASVHTVLTKHGHVVLRVLSGNHDNESAVAVTLACAMFFSSDPRVTVDSDPGYFWFFEFGATLIGATHGDQARMKDMPLMMAARKPEAWGRTKFRIGFVGHIHHASAIEAGGVTVESLQSPAAPDAWHARQGFWAGRSLTAVTFHREHGEISRNKARIVS